METRREWDWEEDKSCMNTFVIEMCRLWPKSDTFISLKLTEKGYIWVHIDAHDSHGFCLDHHHQLHTYQASSFAAVFLFGKCQPLATLPPTPFLSPNVYARCVRTAQLSSAPYTQNVISYTTGDIINYKSYDYYFYCNHHYRESKSITTSGKSEQKDGAVQSVNNEWNKHDDTTSMWHELHTYSFFSTY